MAMTPGMTHERFEALAEAYGGDVARWPAEAREAAALLMAAEPGFTQAVLAPAGTLDAVLDAWRPAHASAGLIERIVAAAPSLRRPRWLGWLSPAALGAGLAAAGLAGVLVGVELSEQTPEARTVAVTNTLSAVSSSLELEEGA
jgi:hypothetical protein